MLFSGLDLLRKLPYSQKVQIDNSSPYRVWRFEDNEGDQPAISKLSRIYNKRKRQFTLEVAGYSTNRKLATLFGVYLKHKKLPLLEINLDLLNKNIILRYQGVTSFQRVTVQFKDIAEWRLLSFAVNDTHFTVTTQCQKEKSVPLPQKLDRISKKAYIVIGAGKSGENKFEVSRLFRHKIKY